jgi:histidinol-phosphate phosphatase family protein
VQDRDGFVPHVDYQRDPLHLADFWGRVEGSSITQPPMAGHALAELRRRGIATGVITNQSGIARGLVTRSQVDGVNLRVDALLGPFDVWEICPHGTEDGCGCRKPAPGMILSACRRLGIATAEAAYIGDIGSDMEAAQAAGLRGMLVPTPLTRHQEVDAAPEVAANLSAAVALLLRPAPVGSRQ